MVIDMEEHKRRPRYKGTHPRKFEEKYKELNPEKYADTVAKVISKGSTPAGMHISIMVKEILDFLQIQPGQKGLDATLGYGGHTRKMLEQLQGQYGLKAAAADWVLNSVISMGMSLNPDAKAVENLRTNFEQQGGRVL